MTKSKQTLELTKPPLELVLRVFTRGKADEAWSWPLTSI